MSAEVDEIVPFSLGGSPIDKSNVQLVHRMCNQKKKNKLIKSFKASEFKEQAIKTSRDW